MKQWVRKQSGFTIVELLIVVVVIAILAAITIVAYNGISNQAKASSVQSDTANSVKSLELFKVTNNRYPTSELEAALKKSGGGNTVSYAAYGSGLGFCVQYSNGSLNYFATNTVQPKEGACGPIINMATNPSLETNSSGWTARWFGSGGSGTGTVGAAGALCGSSGWRKTWTTSGGFQDIGMTYTVPSAVVPDKQYAVSAAMRTSFPTTHRIWVEWLDGSGASLGANGSVAVFSAPNPGEIVYMNILATAPATAATARVNWGPYPTQSNQPGFGVNIPVGATVDSDCVLMAESNYQLNFADGTSPNWSWSGTPHTTTSSGPPV